MGDYSAEACGSQDDNSYLARDYQVQLLSIAERENTILFLPTGSGKTFVAVMLIKAMSKDLEKPYKEGGKRTFFAVNTVALVTQQGDYVARHTHLNVGKYSGDLNVDNWSAERWNTELQQNQVIVLTCQILLDMLNHGFISLENINLIIFDECHHAVSDHCMRRVMQKFEVCRKEDQPRVLGLSATLLNSNCKAKNVKSEIQNLETTFLGRVATVDDIKQVQRFSTNPVEDIIYFEPKYPDHAASGVSRLQNDVMEELKAARDLLMNLDSSVFSLGDEPDVPSPSKSAHLYRINTSPGEREKKRLTSIVNDVQVMLEDYGIFGGYVAALYANIMLHRRKLSMNTAEGKRVISCLLTHMTLVRKIIHDGLEAFSPLDQVLKFSTDKVLQLLELIRKTENPVTIDGSSVRLQDLLEHKKESLESKSCCLIFVERRQAAKCIYQILKHVAEHSVPFKNVKPDFVLGIASNPSSMESSVNKRRHHESILNFRSGECNYLIASDVMEEGVDIPLCSLVVKLDLPKTFRSYVQSKGRARHSTSKFYMFVPATNDKFSKNLEEYRQVETVLKQILVGQNENRFGPSDEEVKDKLYNQEIPPYYSCDKSASVNLVSASVLINRYCALLPQDKFTQLYPLWVMEEILTPRSSPMKQLPGYPQIFSRNKLAYLQLPINAPIRNIIKGIPMHNKRYAKRAVGLIACAILHRRGELGRNDLLPVCHEPEAMDDANLFPNWINEEKIDGVPGSKKLKRMCNKEVSTGLSGCRPKPYRPTYIYHIQQTPVYNVPSPKDSRGCAIYKVLGMERGYAILSSKKLPQVCDFSIFMSSGEIDVRIEPEQEKEGVILSADEIKELELFHVMLFLDLLNVCKQYFVVDKSNTANSYLIAPTCTDSNGKWIIDWDVVRKFSTLPIVENPSPEENSDLQVDDDNFLYEVVTPWYRGSYVERHYVVTKICQDMDAASPFPSTTYSSFEDYFKEKYDLSLNHPDKPLLEVKAISSRIDCIHPKGVAKPFDDTPSVIPLSKRQMQLKNGDFQEHLIPELVTKRLFPATLWLKATTLPTVLHRFSFMQLASELRTQICKETNITRLDPPEGKWKRLPVDCTVEVQENRSLDVPANFFKDTMEVNQIEAPDLDHDIDSLCLLDVVQYHKVEVQENESKIVHQSEWSPIKPALIPENVLKRLEGLAIRDDGDCQGPELADTLCALTGATAGDVINLERLETLGDSFLKFAASTYLYLKYPTLDEGKLTMIKGKMISNRHLFYCGKARNLGGRMKVHALAPQSDWTPPGFAVPNFLKEKLNSSGGITKNILFQLIIPETERRSGILSRDTMRDIEESLYESLTNNTVGTSSTTLEALLGTQNVPDKSVADCVESLIGAWLISGGCTAALRLLGWFGVFPLGKNGPAGKWEELVGTEALEIGRKGIIKDQAEYEIIGGVVDWGDAKNLSSSVQQMSEKIKDISLFRKDISDVKEEGDGRRLYENVEILENSSVEKGYKRDGEHANLCSCPVKRRKFSKISGVNSEAISSSRDELSEIYKKCEVADSSSNVKDFYINANKSSTVIKRKTFLFTDFEVNEHDLDDIDAMEKINSLLSGASGLEKAINYKFQNRSLLLQALTHASYYPNRITECYQRLEFLGDAVLDFVITCHIYETGGNLSPGQLTDLRSALVNNITFASLVVRYGLHRHLLHLSPSLMEAIDTFVEFQLQRDNAVTEDCLVLLEENDCFLAEAIEVPKALGDILESLAGAIFLDSGLSLTAVWQVFYPMMQNEIEAFLKRVPKQPVRELLESDYIVEFMPSEEVKPAVVGDEVERPGLSKPVVMVAVKVRDKASSLERTFYGFGEKKSNAKRAAAKLALRAMGKCCKPQYS
ncbi:endoribonuclease Dicer-like isoform X2 [Ischnura elegans]|uniref:endoribonuclease Dicer-like isoform X2 n=1 Tax=Ischnura elegans TaxID=197161 RepID=UPI001ED89F49|nr:endoribonuclease Dicer-like isoform X2 [Ischnura elegans]